MAFATTLAAAAGAKLALTVVVAVVGFEALSPIRLRDVLRQVLARRPRSPA